ncbi:hypothetical protein ACFP1K_39075 [Sphaerisporangium aureirubrum]|uniref:Uncharacterized protein n=1 Tax=Sphaerisporangium aureirubrum TaxID=1544736 RepID=A0ABW1NV41_9ACTN
MSAVVASLGLTGLVLLATAPMTSPKANAANAAMADPTQVEPTDPTITDSESPDAEETEPTVTVTITEEPDPVVTKTRTVTPRPTRTVKVTKSPKPRASSTSPVAPPPTVSQAPPSGLPVLPTNPPIDTPPPSAEPTVPDPQLSLSLATPTPPTDTAAAAPSASFEDPTPDSVPIEIRNASPEYDQLTLSRRLAIPGVLLAVLVMLGVLVFEGRIRRMAHAAAVRRAGPRPPGRHRGGDDGLPMPGYPIYHGGTAYAPIISFVPVQNYPGGYPQDPQQFGDPQVIGDPQAYGAQPYGPGYDPADAHFEQPPSTPYSSGVVLPAGMSGPSEPWPRPAAPDATMTFPGSPPADMGRAGEGVTLQGSPLPGGAQGPTGTVQGPLPGGPESGKRRGLGKLFRRGGS